jgi:pimeloyl-ACP methyl ester carboxylesterase
MCFKKLSNLGFDNNESVTILSASNPTTSVLFVHGGGGSRFMFLPHARDLVEKGPYQCILLDLPGHGVKMDDPLSLQSAMDWIIEVAKKHAGPNAVYVGGSLGGYIGMELLGRYPTQFKSAVITMCGQDVGVGAGWTARVALSAFNALLPLMSSDTILNGLVKAARANGHLDADMVFETSVRTGSFFHSGKEQVKILTDSNPRKSLPLFKGKILFINGSKDHRDSEHIWKGLCDGRLIVYDGADHFFSHDDRFYNQFMNDLVEFLSE